MSTRAIAPIVGKKQTQVMRDLRQVNTKGSPEPEPEPYRDVVERIATEERAYGS